MLRATLFELGNDEHVLFFGTHHVVFDAWSVDIFFREISELYNANRMAGHPAFRSCRFSTATSRSGSVIGCVERSSMRNASIGGKRSRERLQS